MGSARPPPATREQHPIYNSVEHEHEQAQSDLDRPRETRRIDQRDDVVLHEAAGVASLPAAMSEPLLERRERTDEARELDQRAVDRDGNMHPGQAWPAEHQ